MTQRFWEGWAMASDTFKSHYFRRSGQKVRSLCGLVKLSKAMAPPTDIFAPCKSCKRMKG